MLANLRRVFALAVLAVFVCSFINLSDAEPGWWRSLVGRAQFVPAFLGTLSGREWAALVLAVLMAMTLLFGRVYCSFLCPLGIMQDLAIRLRRLWTQRGGRKPKAAVLHGASPAPFVRYIVLFLSAAAVAGGYATAFVWLDPYTIAARFMAGVANPAAAQMYDHASGLFAADSLQVTPEWARYGASLLIVCLLVLIPLALAWRKGRLYCNTICPVGAFLGILSRHPLVRLSIRKEACIRCGLCARICKAHCIDLRTQTIDTSRCVNCYDCGAVCGREGLRPRLLPFLRRAPSHQAQPRESAPPLETRRAFLGALACSAPLLFTACDSKRRRPRSADPARLGDNRAAAAVPAGARSVERLLDGCTGCGLCISACPTRVLQPSMRAHGWRGLFKPYLNFSLGFCNFDCTACADVCPAGALLPIALAEKQKTQIALAEFHRDRCVVQQNRRECGACTEHCPTKALFTVEGRFPVFEHNLCTACGVCADECPRGAIELKLEGGVREFAVSDDGKCIACGRCADVCPSRAIRTERLLVPSLAPELCIGCGACTFACPVRPERAMTLTPRAVHLTAVRKIEDPAVNPVKEDGFPF